jgi:acyl dehydratase
MNVDSSRRVDTVAVGERVGPVQLKLSVQKLVMIAAANRDFAPTHIDPQAARETGADNAYTNMMFVMAMLERTVEQWAGPRARLVRLRPVQMIGFNRAGDTVTCSGTVTAVDVDARKVSVELWLESGPGRRTAMGTAELILPR